MRRFAVLLVTVMICAHTVSQTFTDIASNFGIDPQVTNNFFGSGMSFYDFNGDGWDDLSFTQSNAPCKFYINNQGSFEETDSFVYGQGLTKHLLWVDYDNDGDSDIFLTADLSPFRLFQNDGEFNFTDVTESAGLPLTYERSWGASFGDYDKDGNLDVYICTYVYEGENYEKLNHLYHNNGDGTFTDVTEYAGVGNGIQLSFGSVWIDYNKDGWQDIYIINDKIYPNTLYHNNGDGTFSDVSVSTSSGIVIDAMTATVGDFNNDTHSDIYMTNTPGGNRLLRNNGNSTFTDISDTVGDILDAYSWGALWVDYDNNGFLDLYVSTFEPLNPDQPNRFYLNNGDETFTEFPEPFLGNHIANSFCPSKGDVNNDGFPDIAVHHKAPYTPFLWLNSGNEENNYIKITLEGTISNKDGIGSWIYIFCGDEVFSHYTLCGENYIGQNSQHNLFGIGEHQTIDSIEVHWLSGIEDVLYNVNANQSIDIIEGQTISPEISTSDDLQLCMGESTELDAGNWDDYLWSNGDTTQVITVSTEGEFWVVISHMGLVLSSDTVHVTLSPPPAISTEIQNTSCHGTTDGQILVINNNGNGIEDIAWANPNADGNPATMLTEGAYQFEVTDQNGCSASGIANVDAPEELWVSLDTSDETAEESGSAVIENISGGTPPYSIFWSNGIYDETEISGLTAGQYSLEIIDANDCSKEISFVIETLVGIDGLYEVQLNLFPNPVTDVIKISGAESVAAFTLYDAMGRRIQMVSDFQNDKEIFQLDVSFLSPGVYVLSIITNQTIQSLPFVKE